ncbi:hypothetical protein LFX25_18970 [Leptospira sp. FAT2]|uniref:hypothetical protein n=1 Tax=Leptospira sanjuanensis TaxID=2879643 RepID=UPI001EE8EEAA|nr:hypothetical protein [Leptospira sanjuanensis]MCG6195327.1 hypothetical protein [Leptospira sanjuanensis]
MYSKILIRFFLVCFSFGCSSNKIEEPVAENYVPYLFLTTASLPCPPREYANPWSFSDSSGDVKAGFLNVSTDGIGHLDLISGNIQDNATHVQFTLTLGNIPESIGVNTNGNVSEPEFEWTYRFQAENSFKIGIVHVPNGSPQNIPFRNLNVFVWQNLEFMGGCGNLNVQGNTAGWVCEKNTIPSLNELSKTKTISVEVTSKNNGIRYSDCN